MPNTLDIGAMRHRIVLQRATASVNGVGQAIKTFADVGEYYAAVEPMSGMELMAARQLEAKTDYRVTMLASIGPILTTDRLQFAARGLVLNISSVFVDTTNTYYTLHCVSKYGQS